MRMSKLSERVGVLRFTEEFMEDRDIPQMLCDLQATPLAVEYDYARMLFLYKVYSPLLPKVAEGEYCPSYYVIHKDDNCCVFDL